MAILSIPEKNIELRDPAEIRSFFNERGVYFDQWTCDVVFDDTATQEEILKAYEKDLKPFMDQGGYQTADVISINKLTKIMMRSVPSSSLSIRTLRMRSVSL